MRLGSAEARARFAAAPVARLATAGREGVPHLVPVTFAVAGDTVYFAVDHKPKRTRELRRLRNIEENPRVALLADHYADDWTTLWWARADGRATVRTDPARCRTPLALLAEKYPQYRDRPPEGPVVAVEVTEWSGWAAADPATWLRRPGPRDSGR
ncbi:TIGR03668 family PPOX class F420-dependent oxidoreductase [Streptomyces sp. VNUA116]|uniref:TIGR03668 family PPOX class F420-dependent oxidoreductase n=1 Tax=Streptomyces sp. VNUA116 TaxID=3062449 RepID=UPI002675ACEA|nr:TIGR03668 family PPOX class F420-dependent oxidoreductase [Streptomyces sp. VNUA116]WKU46554.1 TIGR03668 family PPOX class F420-dependent oxidoreductase [Streptomyces sp. VNUA116]